MSHLGACLWSGFLNCPGAAQHGLPHLTRSIQLIRRDWNGSEKVELKENTILLKNSSQKQPNNNQLLWRLFKEKGNQ